MNVEEAIESRRAQYTGQYSGVLVENKHIERMLELANWAPTHKHTEPWRFLVYEAGAMNRLIDSINDIYVRTTDSAVFDPNFIQKMAGRKEKLSHIIIIVMKRHAQSGIPEFEELAATAMAVQNMWLYTAQFKDIGAYWSTPKVVLGKAFHEHLALKEDETCLGLFMLGSIKDNAIEAVGKRGDWKEKVKWHKN